MPPSDPLPPPPLTDGPAEPALVLYVDDEPANTALFEMHFAGVHNVVTAGSGPEGLELLKSLQEVAAVVSDQKMPGMSGVEFLREVRHVVPLASRMVISAYSQAPVLLAAIQDGQVHDYMTKPWDGPDLSARVGAAVEAWRRRRQLYDAAADRTVLEDQVRGRYDPDRVVGEEGGLRETMSIVERVAASPATVLLRGESGTGKELIARAVHQRSPRRRRAMVAVNCAALPPQLVESELFGHERGAFTGADRRRVGRFEQADRGTLFLDEVGDLPVDVQVKLLRVLQEGQIERVGGGGPLEVDVRVVAATHRDLEGLVETGRFREDLFWRLNVVPIRVPALRERRQDIPELVRYFLARYGARTGARPSASPAAVEGLINHDWPGNVRELENIVERAVVLGGDRELEPEDFSFDLAPRRSNTPPAGLPGIAPAGANGAPTPTPYVMDPPGLHTPPPSPSEAGRGISLRETLREEERVELERALRIARGNVAGAARELAIPRTTFHSKARRHGLL